MKKTIKLHDLDCANCATKIENAVKKVNGVNDASLNFLNQKMMIDSDDDKFDSIIVEVKKIIKKYEPDVTVIV